MDELLVSIGEELAKLNVSNDVIYLLLHGDNRGTVGANVLKRALEGALEKNNIIMSDFDPIRVFMDAALDRGYAWCDKGETDPDYKTRVALSGMAYATGTIMSEMSRTMEAATIR